MPLLLNGVAPPLIALAWALALSDQHSPLAGATLVVLFAMFALVSFALHPTAGPPEAWAPMTKARATRLLLAIACAFAWYGMSPAVMRRSLARTAARGDLVADAIHRFEEEHAAPPASLWKLVPRFLDERPSTGLSSARRFAYSTEGRPGDWSLGVDVAWGSFSYGVLKRNADRSYGTEGPWGEGEEIAGWLHQPVEHEPRYDSE